MRLLLACLLALAWSSAQATPKAIAFADLSNATYAGRALSTKLGDVVSVKDYGAKADGATDDCDAFRSALATGRSVYVPKPGTYYIGCQLTMAADGQELVCETRSANLKLYYASGPQIVVGSDVLTQNMAVRNCSLYSMVAGQAMFAERYVRGFRLFDVRASADQLLRLGDPSLGVDKYAYVTEIYRAELVRVVGATLPYVDAQNFGGQWLIDSSFYEGASRSGTSGWRCNNNIRPRVDDSRWFNTYWSRDDINIEATDCRLTNTQMIGLHSEGALTWPIKLEVTSSTAKDAGSVGFGGWIIDGARLDGGSGGIYIKTARAGTDTSVLSVSHIQITGAADTGGAIWIEASAGLIQQVSVGDVRGTTRAASASTDWITIKGSDSSNTVDGVVVDNIGGISFASPAQPLRSQLRTEGTMNTDTRAGYNILTGGAGARFSDPSGVLAHP